MKQLRRIFVPFLLAMFPALSHAQLLVLNPASPRAFDVVRMQVRWEGIPADEAAIVTMAGNKIQITVKYVSSYTGIPDVPAPQLDVPLGRLPVGSYEVEYYRAFPTNTFLSATMQFSVLPFTANRSAPYPFIDYSDLWWNAAESGWGISIHVKNDKLFAAWFVYDAAGKPNWYTFQAGNWTTSRVYTGLVVKATGPALGGVQGLAGGVTPAQAGTATLTFNSYDSAVFAGTVDGQAFNKTIVRQPF